MSVRVYDLGYVLAVVSLMACSSTPVVPVTVVPVYAENDGVVQTAGAALAAELDLTAGGTATSAIALDFDRDRAAATTTSLLLSRNANGALSVTMDEVTEAFRPTQAQTNSEGTLTQGYVARDDATGKFVSLYAHTGEITDLLGAQSDYAEAVSIFTSEVGRASEQRFVYAIIGTQTRPEVISSGILGRYVGQFGLEILPTDYQSFSKQRVRVTGQAQMSVTADQMISGTLDRLALQLPQSSDRTPISGDVTLLPAAITPDGYEGDLAVAPLVADAVIAAGGTLTGRYGGTFYGPQAEETAGTLAVTGAGPALSMVGAGFFATDQVATP